METSVVDCHSWPTAKGDTDKFDQLEPFLPQNLINSEETHRTLPYKKNCTLSKHFLYILGRSQGDIRLYVKAYILLRLMETWVVNALWSGHMERIDLLSVIVRQDSVNPMEILGLYGNAYILLRLMETWVVNAPFPVHMERIDLLIDLLSVIVCQDSVNPKEI